MKIKISRYYIEPAAVDKLPALYDLSIKASKKVGEMTIIKAMQFVSENKNDYHLNFAHNVMTCSFGN